MMMILLEWNKRHRGDDTIYHGSLLLNEALVFCISYLKTNTSPNLVIATYLNQDEDRKAFCSMSLLLSLNQWRLHVNFFLAKRQYQSSSLLFTPFIHFFLASFRSHNLRAILCTPPRSPPAFLWVHRLSASDHAGPMTEPDTRLV